MVNNETENQVKRGPASSVTITLLVIMAFHILLVSVLIIHLASRFKSVFEGLNVSLPLPTIFFLSISNLWYLWIIFVLFLIGIGILLEISIKGYWRWVNIIYSGLLLILSYIMISACVLSMFQPIVKLQQEIK